MAVKETGSEGQESEGPESPRRNKRRRAICKGLTAYGKPCKHVADKTGYCRFHSSLSMLCAYRDAKAQCKRPAAHGAQYCQHHLELIGKMAIQAPVSTIQLPSFLKFLPTAMAHRAAEINSDPDLTNIRHDIVLLSTRLADLLNGLSDPTLNYFDMLAAFGSLRDAYYSQDDPGVQTGLTALYDYLSKGASQQEAWQEIYGVLDHRQKAIMFERKQIFEDNGMIPVEQVLAIMARLLTVVSMYVDSPEALQGIRNEFNRVALNGDPRPINLSAE